MDFSEIKWLQVEWQEVLDVPFSRFLSPVVSVVESVALKRKEMGKEWGDVCVSLCIDLVAPYLPLQRPSSTGPFFRNGMTFSRCHL